MATWFMTDSLTQYSLFPTMSSTVFPNLGTFQHAEPGLHGDHLKPTPRQ